MKITKINKIKNFGVFKNFVWKAEIRNLSDFNVFYGWNYSGKTTLSRILRCFENKARHIDYLSSKFELEDDCLGTHNEISLGETLSVRVFNSDYIVDNLKWYGSQDGIEPILLLGQESIELTKELEGEKTNLTEAKLERTKLTQVKTSNVSEMNALLTARAKEIKEDLLLTTNFTKTQFEPKVKVLAADTSNSMELSEKAVTNLKNTYQSSEKKASIDKISFNIPDIKLINKEIIDLMKKTVESKVIEKLKNDQILNDWVKAGKFIHKDKTDCEFCGNELPGDLIKRLNEHFSTEYDELLLALDTKIRQLKDMEISVLSPDSAYFYQQLQNSYLESTEELKNKSEDFNNYLKNLSKQLRSKKQKPFEKLELENLINDFKELEQAKLKVNKIIGGHNQKNVGFEREKRDARETLIDYYTQKFIRDNKYVEYQEELLEIDEKISAYDTDIRDITSKIADYEKKLSDTVKGAEKINEYLFQYFGKNDVKVIVNNTEKFQLTRAGEVAKNLSEGEKTAIAFAYFVASLENKDTKLSETVVFIDDPISSLDSNHLFNTYSFIRNKFYELKPDPVTNKLKHKCKAAQLIVSTHNFEFFNLVKDWFNKIKDEQKSFYLVEKTTKASGVESVIKNLPLELLKFKSEYVYLFSIIHEFHNSESSDFRFLYNLPNIIRRFIESFCAFKYLSTRNIEENLNLLIENNIERERVRKFVHYYSHSMGTNTVMEFSDPTESREVVGIVMNALKASDPEHSASLLAQVAH